MEAFLNFQKLASRTKSLPAFIQSGGLGLEKTAELVKLIRRWGFSRRLAAADEEGPVKVQTAG